MLSDEMRYAKLLHYVQTCIRNYIPLGEMKKLCHLKASQPVAGTPNPFARGKEFSFYTLYQTVSSCDFSETVCCYCTFIV